MVDLETRKAYNNSMDLIRLQDIIEAEEGASLRAEEVDGKTMEAVVVVVEIIEGEEEEEAEEEEEITIVRRVVMRTKMKMMKVMRWGPQE